MRSFIAELGADFQYPVALDEAGSVTAKYPTEGIPAAFVINAAGVVTWQGHPSVRTAPAFVSAARMVG